MSKSSFISKRNPGAESTLLTLDPALIDIPNNPNRHKSSYDSEEFHTLKLSIQASNGNLMPILAKRSPVDPLRYELIVGERRYRACLELGIPVLVIVVDSRDASRDYLDRMRENLGRENLSAWEFSKQVAHAMTTMQPINRTELAGALGVSLSMVSRACDLADLDALMVSAFLSPNEIRYQDVKPLKAAWKDDKDAVGLEVANIKEQRGEKDVPGNEVVRRIVRASKTNEKKEKTLAWCKPVPSQTLLDGGRAIGNWQVKEFGTLEVQIIIPMSELQRELLLNHLVAFLKKKVLRQDISTASPSASNVG